MTQKSGPSCPFRAGARLIAGLLAAALAGPLLPDAAAAQDMLARGAPVEVERAAPSAPAPDRPVHRVQQAAAPGTKGFRSPSDNIHCMIDDYGVADRSYAPFLRCDIMSIEGPVPPKPSSCDTDWGKAYAVTPDGATGTLICAGDTIRNERWPVLPYGSVWQQDGFTCRSETTGVTCANAAMHGFTLSRRARTVF